MEIVLSFLCISLASAWQVRPVARNVVRTSLGGTGHLDNAMTLKLLWHQRNVSRFVKSVAVDRDGFC